MYFVQWTNNDDYTDFDEFDYREEAERELTRLVSTGAKIDFIIKGKKVNYEVVEVVTRVELSE